MFNVLADINWLAFGIVAVASVALAGVYFPVLIKKPYAAALGRTGAPAPRQTLLTGLGPIVLILVNTLTSAVLIEALDITAIADAVAFALLVGVGYLTAMTFQIAINPNFPRPLLYGAINAPFFVAASLLTGIVLTVMR